uniref:Uncharacterized protein n=1 Tax=Chromera velia CCMP2878 TaxID=1169474 RepID=A0A0G4F8J3_9ALVE|eukprot:Cvel_15785.t1-p1 / transcript=Cvel_15785.t1 / gene=Cvel_15785 / organism=Chromera_velia_CCMP2878 / gene_product=hypothetical protein / transcript_product=hypothetical protein / location=Cvel_scaffold1184:34051-48862(+) / protein_length=3707 / sequence_SO=supercontig / SO=protein_coding / is_pseudo=false
MQRGSSRRVDFLRSASAPLVSLPAEARETEIEAIPRRTQTQPSSVSRFTSSFSKSVLSSSKIRSSGSSQKNRTQKTSLPRPMRSRSASYSPRKSGAVRTAGAVSPPRTTSPRRTQIIQRGPRHTKLQKTTSAPNSVTTSRPRSPKGTVPKRASTRNVGGTSTPRPKSPTRSLLRPNSPTRSPRSKSPTKSPKAKAAPQKPVSSSSVTFIGCGLSFPHSPPEFPPPTQTHIEFPLGQHTQQTNQTQQGQEPQQPQGATHEHLLLSRSSPLNATASPLALFPNQTSNSPPQTKTNGKWSPPQGVTTPPHVDRQPPRTPTSRPTHTASFSSPHQPAVEPSPLSSAPLNETHDAVRIFRLAEMEASEQSLMENAELRAAELRGLEAAVGSRESRIGEAHRALEAYGSRLEGERVRLEVERGEVAAQRHAMRERVELSRGETKARLSSLGMREAECVWKEPELREKQRTLEGKEESLEVARKRLSEWHQKRQQEEEARMARRRKEAEEEGSRARDQVLARASAEADEARQARASAADAQVQLSYLLHANQNLHSYLQSQAAGLQRSGSLLSQEREDLSRRQTELEEMRRDLEREIETQRAKAQAEETETHAREEDVQRATRSVEEARAAIQELNARQEALELSALQLASFREAARVEAAFVEAQREDASRFLAHVFEEGRAEAAESSHCLSGMMEEAERKETDVQRRENQLKIQADRLQEAQLRARREMLEAAQRKEEAERILAKAAIEGKALSEAQREAEGQIRRNSAEREQEIERQEEERERERLEALQREMAREKEIKALRYQFECERQDIEAERFVIAMREQRLQEKEKDEQKAKEKKTKTDTQRHIPVRIPDDLSVLSVSDSSDLTACIGTAKKKGGRLQRKPRDQEESEEEESEGESEHQNRTRGQKQKGGVSGRGPGESKRTPNREGERLSRHAGQEEGGRGSCRRKEKEKKEDLPSVCERRLTALEAREVELEEGESRIKAKERRLDRLSDQMEEAQQRAAERERKCEELERALRAQADSSVMEMNRVVREAAAKEGAVANELLSLQQTVEDARTEMEYERRSHKEEMEKVKREAAAEIAREKKLLIEREAELESRLRDSEMEKEKAVKERERFLAEVSVLSGEQQRNCDDLSREHELLAFESKRLAEAREEILRIRSDALSASVEESASLERKREQLEADTVVLRRLQEEASVEALRRRERDEREHEEARAENREAFETQMICIGEERTELDERRALLAAAAEEERMELEKEKGRFQRQMELILQQLEEERGKLSEEIGKVAAEAQDQNLKIAQAWRDVNRERVRWEEQQQSELTIWREAAELMEKEREELRARSAQLKEKEKGLEQRFKSIEVDLQERERVMKVEKAKLEDQNRSLQNATREWEEKKRAEEETLEILKSSTEKDVFEQRHALASQKSLLQEQRQRDEETLKQRRKELEAGAAKALQEAQRQVASSLQNLKDREADLQSRTERAERDFREAAERNVASLAAVEEEKGGVRSLMLSLHEEQQTIKTQQAAVREETALNDRERKKVEGLREELRKQKVELEEEKKALGEEKEDFKSQRDRMRETFERVQTDRKQVDEDRETLNVQRLKLESDLARLEGSLSIVNEERQALVEKKLAIESQQAMETEAVEAREDAVEEATIEAFKQIQEARDLLEQDASSAQEGVKAQACALQKRAEELAEAARHFEKRAAAVSEYETDIRKREGELEKAKLRHQEEIGEAAVLLAEARTGLLEQARAFFQQTCRLQMFKKSRRKGQEISERRKGRREPSPPSKAKRIPGSSSFPFPPLPVEDLSLQRHSSFSDGGEGSSEVRDLPRGRIRRVPRWFSSSETDTESGGTEDPFESGCPLQSSESLSTSAPNEGPPFDSHSLSVSVPRQQQTEREREFRKKTSSFEVLEDEAPLGVWKEPEGGEGRLAREMKAFRVARGRLSGEATAVERGLREAESRVGIGVDVRQMKQLLHKLAEALVRERETLVELESQKGVLKEERDGLERQVGQIRETLVAAQNEAKRIAHSREERTKRRGSALSPGRSREDPADRPSSSPSPRRTDGGTVTVPRFCLARDGEERTIEVELSRLREDRKSLERETGGARETLQRLNTEAETCIESLRQKRAEVKSRRETREEIESVRGQIEAVRGTLANVRGDLERLASEKDGKLRELKELKSSINSATKKLGALRTALSHEETLRAIRAEAHVSFARVPSPPPSRTQTPSRSVDRQRGDIGGDGATEAEACAWIPGIPSDADSSFLSQRLPGPLVPMRSLIAAVCKVLQKELSDDGEAEEIEEAQDMLAVFKEEVRGLCGQPEGRERGRGAFESRDTRPTSAPLPKPNRQAPSSELHFSLSALDASLSLSLYASVLEIRERELEEAGREVGRRASDLQTALLKSPEEGVDGGDLEREMETLARRALSLREARTRVGEERRVIEEARKGGKQKGSACEMERFAEAVSRRMQELQKDGGGRSALCEWMHKHMSSLLKETNSLCAFRDTLTKREEALQRDLQEVAEEREELKELKDLLEAEGVRLANVSVELRRDGGGSVVESLNQAREALVKKQKDLEIQRSDLCAQKQSLQTREKELRELNDQTEEARKTLEGERNEFQIARTTLEGERHEFEIAKSSLFPHPPHESMSPAPPVTSHSVHQFVPPEGQRLVLRTSASPPSHPQSVPHPSLPQPQSPIPRPSNWNSNSFPLPPGGITTNDHHQSSSPVCPPLPQDPSRFLQSTSESAEPQGERRASPHQPGERNDRQEQNLLPLSSPLQQQQQVGMDEALEHVQAYERSAELSRELEAVQTRLSVVETEFSALRAERQEAEREGQVLSSLLSRLSLGIQALHTISKGTDSEMEIEAAGERSPPLTVVVHPDPQEHEEGTRSPCSLKRLSADASVCLETLDSLLRNTRDRPNVPPSPSLPKMMDHDAPVASTQNQSPAIDQGSKETAALRSCISALEAEAQTLREERREAARDGRELAVLLERLACQVTALQAAHAQSEQREAELSMCLRRVTEERAVASAAPPQASQESVQENAELQETLRRLLEQVSDGIATLSERREKEREASTALEVERREVERLREEVAENKRKFASVEERSAQLHRSRQSLWAHFSVLLRKVEGIRSEMFVMRDKTASLLRSFGECMERIHSTAVPSLTRRYEADMGGMQKALEVLKKEASQSRNAHGEAETHAKKLKADMEASSAEKRKLEEALSASKSEKEALETETRAVLESHQRLRRSMQAKLQEMGIDVSAAWKKANASTETPGDALQGQAKTSLQHEKLKEQVTAEEAELPTYADAMSKKPPEHANWREAAEDVEGDPEMRAVKAVKEALEAKAERDELKIQVELSQERLKEVMKEVHSVFLDNRRLSNCDEEARTFKSALVEMRDFCIAQNNHLRQTFDLQLHSSFSISEEEKEKEGNRDTPLSKTGSQFRSPVKVFGPLPKEMPQHLADLADRARAELQEGVVALSAQMPFGTSQETQGTVSVRTWTVPSCSFQQAQQQQQQEPSSSSSYGPAVPLSGRKRGTVAAFPPPSPAPFPLLGPDGEVETTVDFTRGLLQKVVSLSSQEKRMAALHRICLKLSERVDILTAALSVEDPSRCLESSGERQDDATQMLSVSVSSAKREMVLQSVQSHDKDGETSAVPLSARGQDPALLRVVDLACGFRAKWKETAWLLKAEKKRRQELQERLEREMGGRGQLMRHN